MKMVKVTIDNQEIEVSAESTILQAVRKMGIEIPTLCYNEILEENNAASCRLCVVEIQGRRRKQLVTSCTTKVKDGMLIETNTERVIKARKNILELLITNHPLDCMTCDKAGNCKLQDYCYEYDVKDSKYRGGRVKKFDIDCSNQFYYRDENKCILCGNCTRLCSNIQRVDAITSAARGFKNYITPAFDEKLEESTCVSCGNCMSVCPVGAIMPKTKEKFRTWDIQKKVKTTCPYCGVGCQMELLVKDNKVVGVEPYNGLANKGLLCVKGRFGSNFINHSDRLKTPLIKKDGKFVEVSWDEALDLIANKIKETKEEFGSNALAGLASARVTNEENYLFQKMVRGVFGTNNIDHCARLCHASTVAGLATTFGSGAMTNSNVEAIDSDVFFITGSNTTETHPVIGSFIRRAKAKGAKIIVADPRRITLAEEADIFIQIKPGTNVALFNGMMNVIIEEGLQDIEYIKERTENFDLLVEVVKNYPPEKAAEICQVDPEDIRNAAKLYASGEKASIYYSMGVTQHSTGTQGVMSIANLAMLCGNIGKEFSGVNPLRGQNNVQGACDLGALPGDFPGYQKVNNPEVIEKFENAWGVKLSNESGLTVTEIMKNGNEGEIKLLYIMGENPMISDPDLNHVEKALEKIDFVIVQDIFLTETAKYADVILPATTFAEKEGTFTNTERRIQRVRKAIEPIGQSKPDWEILTNLMWKLGYIKEYNNPSEIMEEISSVTPQYGGISYDRIEEEGLQWPCPTKDHMGTKYLHKGTFASGKGLFKPAEYIESAELPDAEYPFILTTGRMLYHFHTRSMTGRVEGIDNLFPESYIEINPLTAGKLNISDGERIKVISRRGKITSTAKLKDIVEEDVMFMPFHFADGAANYLTNSVLDPTAKIPELKVCAIKVEKM